MKRKLKILALIILLAIAAFVRLYHIDQYMQYQGDEGRDAIVLWKMATKGKLTLIGPGTSVGNMYNGPLYYYLVLPSFIVSGLSAVGPSIFVALLSVVTTWFIYKVGKEWFSPLTGSTAAVLYALSPTVIIYSHSSWNPNVMPFFALLSIYSVWRLDQDRNPKWLLVTAPALAFAIQSHYLGLLLIPTLALWTIVYLWKSKSEDLDRSKKYLLISAAIFIFLMSPIAIFDLRHDFLNSKAMWKFFSERQTTVNFKVYKAFPEIIPLFTQATTRLIAATVDNLGKVTAFVLGISVFILLYFRKREKALWFLLSWIAFGLLGLGLYKQTIYDHYFGFIFPAIFLLFGLVVDFFWNRKTLYRLPVVGAFLGLLWTNVLHNPLWSYPNYLYQQTEVISKVILQESGGKPFNLGMIAAHNYDPGYRFVLLKLGAPLKEVPPDMTDQLFVVCEDKVADCNPVGHPKAEIANFGWTKIAGVWHFTWGPTLFRLVHNFPATPSAETK